MSESYGATGKGIRPSNILDMKKPILVALTILMALGVVTPSGAAPKMVRLGTDPANDGPPSLDVTYLDVGKTGKALEIRIGIANILPAIRSIPEAPGVEWIFEVKGRTFIAEGVPGTTPTFYLFELVGDSFTQLADPEGTYEAADGFIRMLVPLDTIGATRKGTRISGTGPSGTEDVDAHVHYPGGENYPDKMATTKDFVVP
jgi:hypothetical protein